MQVNPSDPAFRLSADSTKTITERRDTKNYISQLFGPQFPEIKNGFFNAHMTRGIIIQPHWHPNASEMVYMISGSVITSVFNPFTQKLMSYQIGPGEVSMLPRGWFHWIIALTDDVHLLTIFDVPTPDVVLGSDFLRFTPAEVMNRAYCIDPTAYAQTVAPIRKSTILGPPTDCASANVPNAHPVQPSTQQHQSYFAGPAAANPNPSTFS
ncbi:cupin domain-containing protein [Sporolactobacillus sp. STSJ-5]|uniref:cupin domain-containing protein n=1 Tax=Sporolactobacillus sp. STSJ-5 TaxID=2965076 RepID=UPI0021044245|nr:cupin domain-containing protein [Sporolactobacillus sp. STSJ-5]MCQ2010295.1 cupin domain-containing protein [Sporolactobacillus sp. STSJ-5]